MPLLRLIMLLASLLTAIHCNADGTSHKSRGGELSIDSDKAMVIDGVITQGNILPLGDEMIKRASRSDGEVQLIINSPGGDVITGFIFINQMEAARKAGLRISCFVPTFAASMAYQILLHCDERHTLNKSFLLWHRARTMLGGMFGSPMTAPELLRMGRDLDRLDTAIFAEVFKYMGKEVSEKDLRYHFENETLHVGSELHAIAPNFLTTHSAVEGLMEALTDQKILRNKKPEMFGFRKGQMIYIAPQVWNGLYERGAVTVDPEAK